MKLRIALRTLQSPTGALVLVLTAIICTALILALHVATDMTDLVTALQKASASENATRLRMLLFAAALGSIALAALAAFAQIARARDARAAAEAREQVRAFLHTAQEGFFLLDADLRIGAVWSEALTRMFGRQTLTGVALEELLQELLPQQALSTVAQDIKLVWDEGAQENFQPVINALSALEIQVDDERGGRETRYLQINFRPIVSAAGVKQVMASVADVTLNVLLAREVAEAHSHADAQVDTLLNVMQIDPLQLAVFLDATEAGLQLVNAILKEPARTDGEFRAKLDRLLSELHAIKGDASALGVTGVAQRAHLIEDHLGALKERPELTGVDFLPLVLKLDELLAHLRSIREVNDRITELRDGSLATAFQSHALVNERAAPQVDELATTLQGLAARLGRDQQKKFRLSLNGLAQIPAEYRTTVRDLLIQLLRNSAVHGIEPPDVRRARTKAEEGLVRAEFRANAEGYELVFEDDGAGLALEKLKTAAIRKHLTTAAEAARMDTRAAMGLIFRAGVTTCERITMDAGRGVGMELVARRIAALGGKIVLSTDRGKFTRFKIALPAPQSADSAVA